MVDADNFGAELRDLVQHASELHELLVEQVNAAPPEAAGSLRALSTLIGDNIGQREAFVGSEQRSPGAQLH